MFCLNQRVLAGRKKEGTFNTIENVRFDQYPEFSRVMQNSGKKHLALGDKIIICLLRYCRW
jgi:hypothetical protein